MRATASSSSAAPTAPTAPLDHQDRRRLRLQHGPTAYQRCPQLASEATDAGFSGDGTLEVWKIKNGGNGWSHPVHVHFEEGVILSRDGKAPPEWEKWARKDVYRIGPDKDSSEEVEMAIRFREFAGTYMEHCHNTQHEDSSMLLRWDIEHPGQFQVMPTPCQAGMACNTSTPPPCRPSARPTATVVATKTRQQTTCGGERQCRHQCRQADRAQRAGQRHRPGRQPAADGQRPGSQPTRAWAR
jgi:hypothetical protein